MAKKSILMEILQKYNLADSFTHALCIDEIDASINSKTRVDVVNSWDIYQLAHLIDRNHQIWKNLIRENFLYSSIIDTCYVFPKPKNAIDPFESHQAIIHKIYRKYILYTKKKHFADESFEGSFGKDLIADVSAHENQVLRSAVKKLPSLNSALMKQIQKDKIDRIISTILFPIGIVRAFFSYLTQGHMRFWRSDKTINLFSQRMLLTKFNEVNANANKKSLNDFRQQQVKKPKQKVKKRVRFNITVNDSSVDSTATTKVGNDSLESTPTTTSSIKPGSNASTG